MENLKTETPRRPDAIWDWIIQVSGIALLGLLFIALFTGNEYPHTHVMIGYAITVLFVAGGFWMIVRPRLPILPQDLYTPSGFKAQLHNAGKLPKVVATVFLLMAAMPLCALLLMLLTHTIWGATWVDEMHEVVAYFAVGLVVYYVAMVMVASIGHVDGRVRALFSSAKPHNEI
jgi:hypothetical protein